MKRINLNEMLELANEAIRRIERKVDGKSGWPVNWATVRAVDVWSCVNADGQERITIEVVEAAPDAYGFQNAIVREMDNILREHGSSLDTKLMDGLERAPMIEVWTQW